MISWKPFSKMFAAKMTFHKPRNGFEEHKLDRLLAQHCEPPPHNRTIEHSWTLSPHVLQLSRCVALHHPPQSPCRTRGGLVVGGGCHSSSCSLETFLPKFSPLFGYILLHRHYHIAPTLKVNTSNTREETIQQMENKKEKLKKQWKGKQWDKGEIHT